MPIDDSLLEGLDEETANAIRAAAQQEANAAAQAALQQRESAAAALGQVDQAKYARALSLIRSGVEPMPSVPTDKLDEFLAQREDYFAKLGVPNPMAPAEGTPPPSVPESYVAPAEEPDVGWGAPQNPGGGPAPKGRVDDLREAMKKGDRAAIIAHIHELGHEGIRTVREAQYPLQAHMPIID